MAVTSVDFINAMRTLIATIEESKKNYTVKLSGIYGAKTYSCVGDAVERVMQRVRSPGTIKVLITTTTLSAVVSISEDFKVIETTGNSELAGEFVKILNFTTT